MKRLPAPPLPGWLAEQLPFERTMVKVESHWCHVMTSGAGIPVVMLHGNPTWGYLYRKVAKALDPRVFQSVMPDLIGLGFSSKPRDAKIHQLVDHGRWISDVIDDLGVERCILVVQDWGGPVGLSAFGDCLEKVAGLVLLNTVVGPPRQGFKPTLFHRLSQAPLVGEFLFKGLNFPQSMLWLAQGDRRSIGAQETQAYRYPLEGWRNVAPLALARMVPDGFHHQSIPELRRCQQTLLRFEGPSAIVWGDRDPILGSVRKWVEKLMPEARVTRTAGGHFIQEEHPELIAEAIQWVAEESGAF